jgi:nucleoid DNA-binding protein
MAKDDLIHDIAISTGITQSDVELILTSALELIRERVTAGKEVRFKSFGVFKTRRRPPKIARNLKGKGNKRKKPEPMLLPAATVPHFKASKKFLKAA